MVVALFEKKIVFLQPLSGVLVIIKGKFINNQIILNSGCSAVG